jgi:hypothetical protein
VAPVSGRVTAVWHRATRPIASIASVVVGAVAWLLAALGLRESAAGQSGESVVIDVRDTARAPVETGTGSTASSLRDGEGVRSP